MTVDEDDVARSVGHDKAIRDRLQGLSAQSTENLFAELAIALSESSKPGYGDPEEVNRDDRVPRTISARKKAKLQPLGERIFRRWNQALHEFVCNPKPADRALQRRLISVMTGKINTASALAAVLVGHFAMTAGVATILAALFIRILGTPTRAELCETWAKSLDLPMKIPRRPPKRKPR